MSGTAGFVACIVTGRNEVVAKVIFLHLSVILFTGGGGLAQCILGYPPCQGDTPCKGDPPAKETPSPPGPHPRGKLRGIRSRPTPKGETEGGSDPGPHPRGKLRGIRSRPTPKGKIEGDQIQAHAKGGN